MEGMSRGTELSAGSIFTISLHLKSDFLRRVTFGGIGLIRGGLFMGFVVLWVFIFLVCCDGKFIFSLKKSERTTNLLQVTNT